MYKSNDNRLKKIEGIVQDYTLVLSTRDYRHLGQIGNFKSLSNNINLNSANEISFAIYKADLLDIYKHMNIPYESYKKLINDLWDKIVDFKLVWVKELNEYYEIKVSLDDALETVKTITGTSLCEAELSQTNIYGMEINTDVDIARDDYYIDFPTVFYRDVENIDLYNDIWNDNEKKNIFTVYKNESNDNNNLIVDEEATLLKRYNILKSSSLLHRSLVDVPHYKIGHVDKSLKDEILTFSVNGSSIYDFLTGECAQQLNCLFLFDSTTRTINVYDLYNVCQNNDCNYRGDDFIYDEEMMQYKCPECGSYNYKHYGEDTAIYIDKNNLTDAIKLETNGDNVKNCFRLSSGDDVMDVAIMSLNPNGSKYLYYISESQRNDMSPELINKIDSYNILLEENEKYYEDLTLDIWKTQAEIDKLTHTMMPTIEMTEVTAQTEVAKLINSETGINSVNSIVGVSQIYKNMFEDVVSNAVKNYVKTFVMTGFVKVEIIKNGSTNDLDADVPIFTPSLNENGELLVDDKGYHSGVWEGNIRITNYSDEEDIATTGRIKINITDNYQEYIDQKILKGFAEEYKDEGSLFDVLATDDIDKFKEYLSKYCKVRLESFYDSVEGAIITLDEANSGDVGKSVYDSLAPKLKEKLKAIQDALLKIESDINNLTNGYFDSNNVYIKGLNDYIKEKELLQSELNFENYLGDLYPIFCSYRREGEYSNSNFTSTGLDDSGLLSKAKEFLKIAKQELKKAGEPEFTISTTLYNLLAIDEFKPLVNKFKLGNWIQIRVDGVLYKLRLIGYGINFDDIQNLNVVFSNVTKKNDITKKVQNLFQSAQSISTTYDYVAKQASQGNKANDTLNNTVSNGLNSSLVKIKNNDKEEVVWDKNGIICRSWDDELDDYNPKQMRITHNVMAFTKNNWKDVVQAIGEHNCEIYNKETYLREIYEGYGITTEFINSGYVVGSTIVGGNIFSNNYEMIEQTGNIEKDKYNCKGSFIDLENNQFSFGGELTWDGEDLNISGNSVSSAINGLSSTPGKLKIKPESIDVSESKISSSQIESITYSQISDLENITVKAENIDVATSKIKKEQIKSIDASQIEGTINIGTVKAENITGKISSEKIENTLNNKTISGSFNGEINVTSTTTTDGTVTYNGVSGKYTVGGDTIFTILNGIIVAVTPKSLT